MTEPRRLVLLRHGQTTWNAQRRVQGQAESELDELGHRQAAAVAPVLAALQPTVLWSSDSVRARDTAAYVAKETGLEPVHDARLREYFVADRQGLTHEEYAALAPEEFARVPGRRLRRRPRRRDRGAGVHAGRRRRPRRARPDRTR